MEKTVIVLWALLGVVLLIFFLLLIVHMHQEDQLCFAPRRKTADIERGCALPEIPSIHQPTTGPRLNVFPPTAGTVDRGSETKSRREPRRFGGKKDLKPLRLADVAQHTADRGTQSARVIHQRQGNADVGKVRVPQSAR
ncbi:hypothetical protein C7974DRAFT_376255 [Boeremia exigua]|uniref:uncharacterized protein n=1 Tax=Boeremia exigua TaxID=749465 RepID=UPI001E8CA044|nr:uncharacterized protein C7974DRAFT_376255 [Boeremia exigua]KAH6629412.1 hypothetical protein C7974DRAFT_376255 [Boeremia exigua]